MSSPRIFRYFKTSPEIIRLAVMMYVRYPLSIRNVEDLLHERGIDITHETVRFWCNRFGTIFAAEIRRSGVQAMQSFRHRRWHLDEVFVKIDGVKHYLGRAVDHEGEVLESFNGSLRDECLNEEIFDTLADARRTLALWRYDYNNVGPHSSLGNRTPAEACRALEQHEGSAPGALAHPEPNHYQPEGLSL